MTSSRSRGKSIARTDCRQRVKRSPSLRPMTITETSGSVTLGDSGDITSDYECDRYDVKVESGIDERRVRSVCAARRGQLRRAAGANVFLSANDGASTKCHDNAASASVGRKAKAKSDDAESCEPKRYIRSC